MQTTSLDVLEKTQLPANQVRAILQAMDFEINARQERLATKSDLNDTINASKNDMLEAVQQMMKKDISDAVQTMRNELKDAVHLLELKIVGFESRLTRWVFTCMLGQSVVIAGAVYFAVTHLRQ